MLLFFTVTVLYYRHTQCMVYIDIFVKECALSLQILKCFQLVQSEFVPTKVSDFTLSECLSNF